jgi:hypothetical protein
MHCVWKPRITQIAPGPHRHASLATTKTNKKELIEQRTANRDSKNGDLTGILSGQSRNWHQGRIAGGFDVVSIDRSIGASAFVASVIVATVGSFCASHNNTLVDICTIEDN